MSREKRKRKFTRPAVPITHEERKRRALVASAKLHRIQRYHVRVQYTGSMWAVCPYCGQINRWQVSRNHWWVECNGDSCRGKFIPKLTLLAMPGGGRQTIPPDFIIPDEDGEETLKEAFPLGDMGAWRQGQCVHGMEKLSEVSTNTKTEVTGR